LGDSPVIGIDANSNVLDALSLMSKYLVFIKNTYTKQHVLFCCYCCIGSHGVSSVAVLGAGKEVLGNISMTDVKVSIPLYTKNYPFTPFVIACNEGVHPSFTLEDMLSICQSYPFSTRNC
jgi:hypothetical protein